MILTSIIEKVNNDKRLIPDLAKSEKGNNFRAVSESAILDVLDPILREHNVFYTIAVKEQHLDIREAYGSKGKKLQFIATCTITLKFFEELDAGEDNYLCDIDAIGMGIDDNDKAMGKAYTYAVKYALLKLFRLRYGDDPDAKVSEPLIIDKKTIEIIDKAINESHGKTPTQKKGTSASGKKEPLMTENQRDYILGMMKQKNVSEGIIIGKFHVEPSFDDEIPMKTARAIIKYLEEYQEEELDLPF